MKTLKEIFMDLHEDEVDLAHALLRWMIGKYGRKSDEVEQLYDQHQEMH